MHRIVIFIPYKIKNASAIIISFVVNTLRKYIPVTNVMCTVQLYIQIYLVSLLLIFIGTS